MKETFYERIGEAVCRQRLANGLEVCVVPKPGYSKKYAFFSTRYGGMDTLPAGWKMAGYSGRYRALSGAQDV